ncbi:MAG TPA: hypothetical protein VGG19_20660 [Tepidisphaeraceae bacterium]|jgi:hypothetical protein
MSEQTPETPAGNGRTAAGRFTSGNKAGKGNPMNRKAQEIRNALLGAATAQDVKDICSRLIDGAKGGDLQFIREWLNRTVGVPVASDILERIERLEALAEKAGEQ